MNCLENIVSVNGAHPIKRVINDRRHLHENWPYVVSVSSTYAQVDVCILLYIPFFAHCII